MVYNDFGILRAAEDCQALFACCVHDPQLSQQSWIISGQANFNLWCTGINATSADKSSLDYRLRDHGEVHDDVCGLLKALTEVLRTSQELVVRQSRGNDRLDSIRESTSPYQERSDGESSRDCDSWGSMSNGSGGPDYSSGDEALDPSLSMQAFYAKRMLNQLHRVSLNIQKSGNQYIFHKTDSKLDWNSEVVDKFRQHLTVIILRKMWDRGGSEAVKIRRVSEFENLTGIQKQLVENNILRRNRIERSRESPRPARPPSQIFVREQRPAVQMSASPQLSAGRARMINPSRTKGRQEPVTPTQTLTATDVDSQLNTHLVFRPPRSLTPSNLIGTGSILTYPSIPLTSAEGVLSCPYCGDSLPIEWSYQMHDERWRAHVAHDLLPYSCIMEDCETPTEMYLTSHALNTHMLEAHSQTYWKCSLCDSIDELDADLFADIEQWTSHMKDSHQGRLSAEDLESLEELHKRRMIGPLYCPLCDEFQMEGLCSTIPDHILGELHAFSLRALPIDEDPSDLGFNDSFDSQGASCHSERSGLNSQSASIYSPPSGLESQREGLDILMTSSDSQTASVDIEGWVIKSQTAIPGHQTKSLDSLSPKSVKLQEQSLASGSLESSDGIFSDIMSSTAQSTMPTEFYSLTSIKLQGALKAEMRDCGGFLQEPLIKKILTPQQVTELLAEVPYRSYPECKVLAEKILCKEKRNPSYVILFAILILVGRSEKITQFITAGVDDSKLPLQYDGSIDAFCVGDSAVTCISDWGHKDKDLFEDFQYKLTVPYMEMDSITGNARHYVFSESQWLPWHEGLEKKKKKNVGINSTVYQVEILPQRQGFGTVLKSAGLNNGSFALKTIRPSTHNHPKQMEVYMREISALRNFNGAMHPNLVTFLASYELGTNYHFLFPWAEFNLFEYWEAFPNIDSRSKSTMDWFVQQLKGISEAINTIHNPTTTREYVCHGNIKPTKILVFESDKYPDGIMVLAEIGITTIHNTRSRPREPMEKYLPRDDTYQAPEVNLERAIDSRAHDIWSLGCLFLEMIVWFVRGYEGIKHFSKERETTHSIDKFMVSNFYDIVVQEERPFNQPWKYGIRVKPQVFQTCEDIRQSKESSQLVCDILDVVQNEMIVVLSETKRRSPSETIMNHFVKIARNCSEGDPAYYQSHFSPPPRQRRTAELGPVEVQFNHEALETISKRRPRFQGYPGEFQGPLSTEQYRELGRGSVEE